MELAQNRKHDSSPGNPRIKGRSEMAYVNDYAPRLRAQQQQASDQAVIDELEGMAAPLMLAIKATVLAVFLCQVWDAMSGSVEKYVQLAADQEAMVQCINGKTIGMGDSVLRCHVYELNTRLAEVSK
jgi:hypothetical protein